MTFFPSRNEREKTPTNFVLLNCPSARLTISISRKTRNLKKKPIVPVSFKYEGFAINKLFLSVSGVQTSKGRQDVCGEGGGGCLTEVIILFIYYHVIQIILFLHRHVFENISLYCVNEIIHLLC